MAKLTILPFCCVDSMHAQKNMKINASGKAVDKLGSVSCTFGKKITRIGSVWGGFTCMLTLAWNVGNKRLAWLLSFNIAYRFYTFAVQGPLNKNST